MTSKPLVISAVFALSAGAALWLASASAVAGSPLLCKGPTRNAVVSCCQKEVAQKRPIWMSRAELSCSQVVTCGGSFSRKLRCFVEIPTNPNTTHDQPGPRQQQLSDIRAKSHILRIGTTVLGLPLYSFEYRARPGTYIGVMAQDVLKVQPSAVSVGNDGFYRVDYSQLGIEMLRVK